MGENNASQPQNVGFDNFYGFLCARSNAGVDANSALLPPR
jgi:hypothetical protein